MTCTNEDLYTMVKDGKVYHQDLQSGLTYSSWSSYPSSSEFLRNTSFSPHILSLVLLLFCCCSLTKSNSVTPWTAACQAPLSLTISQSLLKFMSIELVMPSCYFILCHSLLLLPSIFPSIGVFSKESTLHIRWPMFCSFSFNISSSSELFFQAKSWPVLVD